MQPVGNEQIEEEEEDIFETNVDEDECLDDNETGITDKCPNVRLINEQLVSTTYCQHDDFAEVMGNTNAVIAAYTTAQARL
uniref:Uncharacterized protein n=1 Tax=Romanomermis culicivorax TaxID=13658 RepID=A0A915IY92_ROMCU